MNDFLSTLGIDDDSIGTWIGSQRLNSEDKIQSFSPVDSALIGAVSTTSANQYAKVVDAAQDAFINWRSRPAPQRGEIIRQFGQKLRKFKNPLGSLVSYEIWETPPASKYSIVKLYSPI